VAVDESEYALAAAGWFRALRLPEAEVTILHVVGPPEDCTPQLLTLKAPRFREPAQAVIRMTNERGRQVLKLARKALAHRGLTIHQSRHDHCGAIGLGGGLDSWHLSCARFRWS
jgi:hypothetical protein